MKEGFKSEGVMQAVTEVQSPSFLISEEQLIRNGEILHDVAERSKAKVVLAQKAFAQPQLYPLLSRYLDGACASGPWEAKLAKEHFAAGKEVITCSPAYTEDDIEALLPITNHLDFNSLSQWEQFRERCLSYRLEHNSALEFGLRINPECSTGETPLYDPCATGSRLGVLASQLKEFDEFKDKASLEGTLLEGISGLHFHTLCEQGVDDLQKTVEAVEQSFGWLLSRPEINYLNLGGGHWITKPDYDCDCLVELVRRLSEQYSLQIWLEPGEAVAIHSGVLVSSVLDLVENGEVTNVILDISATAHMPDVLEMPYRPEVFLTDGDSGENPHKKEYTYRLTGNTCLAGDVIGDYSFSQQLRVGDRIIFDDMAHYTTVKSTFFNGVKHPSIQLIKKDGSVECLRQFEYDDFFRLKA